MVRFYILAASAGLALAYLVFLLAYFSALPSWRSLDFLMTPGQIERALAAYGPDDVAWHLRGTQVYDTIFPAFYGVVVTALVMRYFNGWKLAVMIALTWISVGADYIENYYTVQLLAGKTEVIARHLLATWIKFIAVTAPMDLGLLYLWRELKARRLGSTG